MQIAGEWTGGAALDDRSREASLLARARAGDTAAMEDLLSVHERSLFALCGGILGNNQDAEDAVQESYLRALRALPKFHGGSGVRTWLYRIALNVCLEWNRAKRPAMSLADSPAQTASPESVVICSLQITEALQSLLPRYRAVWLLRELDGWSVAEIAEAMRYSRKRVENELYKARKMLAQWREEQAGGDSE